MKNKTELRKKLLEERKDLSLVDVIEKSELITDRLLESDIYKKADVVLCYFDYMNEVRTDMILAGAMENGKQLYFPKVKPDDLSMEFYRFNSFADIKPGYKNIIEPIGNTECFKYGEQKHKNILMIIPGVGFDRTGYRIGYGKGYYDRYLADKTDIFKCGICYSLQLVDDCFHDINDIKMNCIISEEEIINGNY